MSDETRLCSTCGHVGEPMRVTRGSFGIEVLLWLCFLVPGLIYSIWRLGSRHDGCAMCGATTLLPLNSPVAKTFAQAHNLVVPVAPRADSSFGYGVGRFIGSLFKRSKTRP